MNFNLIILFISLILGVIGLLIGISVSSRFTGKLRIASLFLLLALIFIIIKDILNIFFPILDYSETIKSSLTIATIISIFISLLNLRLIINNIDHKYNK